MTKTCESEGCGTRASFNKEGETKGRFCVLHKEPGMINVIDKTCESNGCGTRPTYGIPGYKTSRCYKHRIKGMIRNSNSKCKENKCKEKALYGINFKPEHCEKHKLENENNLVERECESCNLIMILDKNNKCEYCNPESFKMSRLAKQNALMSYLDNRMLLGESTDTIIENGECGKERPDRVFDFGDKIIVLECDEYQHRERNCDCEQIRMVNISQSFGGIPVYFIRWNPDNYTPGNINKNPEDLNKRYKLCGDLIEGIKNSRVELEKTLLSVIYLYFDGWNGLNKEKWVEIL